MACQDLKSSTVTTTDFEDLIPSSTSSLCERVYSTLIRLPSKLKQFVEFIIDSNGDVQANFISNIIPPGVITSWGGISTTPPTGWLYCDGSAVSRCDFANLFAAIATTWGSGNGTTTFNVPNFKDKFPVGASNTKNPAATGGEETHTLTTAEMPSHTHVVTTNSYDAQTGSGDSQVVGLFGLGPSGSFTGPLSSEATGGGGSHNNMPPYVAVKYIIKT